MHINMEIRQYNDIAICNYNIYIYVLIGNSY